MEYVAFVDGYFLLGLNQQIFLEIPKDRNELEWCAAAFLERVVQTDSLDGYIQEFQDEEIKYYVKWLAPSMVFWAERYAKHHNAEGIRLAKHYQEAKSSMVSSSNIVTACSKVACEVEISKLTDEGGVEFASTDSDVAENYQYAEEETTRLGHANCSINFLAEVMEKLLPSVEPRKFGKNFMDDMLDIVDEMEEVTLAYCLQVEKVLICSGSICELFGNITKFGLCNHSQTDLGHDKCSFFKSYGQTKLVHANQSKEVLLGAMVELLRHADTKLKNDILLNVQLRT